MVTNIIIVDRSAGPGSFDAMSTQSQDPFSVLRVSAESWGVSVDQCATDILAVKRAEWCLPDRCLVIVGKPEYLSFIAVHSSPGEERMQSFVGRLVQAGIRPQLIVILKGDESPNDIDAKVREAIAAALSSSRAPEAA